MAEKEYIEREAALRAMASLLNQKFICVPDSLTQAATTAGYMDGVKDADIRLRSIPATDVRPVARGEWKAYNNTYMCSACGRPVLFWQSNFCPNCGAMMEASDGKD